MEITKKFVPQWVDIEHEGEKLGFLCAPLTASQVITSREMTTDPKLCGEGLMQSIRYAVRNWRGITRDGATIDYSIAELEEFFTGPKLAGVLLQLGGEIIKRSAVTEDERKNS